MRAQPEKGGGALGASTTRKKGEFGTGFVKGRVSGIEVGQKGVLGTYLFIIFTFTCQHDQLMGVCSGRLKKGDPTQLTI